VSPVLRKIQLLREALSLASVPRLGGWYQPALRDSRRARERLNHFQNQPPPTILDKNIMLFLYKPDA